MKRIAPDGGLPIESIRLVQEDFIQLGGPVQPEGGADQAIDALEKENKLWNETEIKITYSKEAVNEETKKIYICPFSGKVFGDNTHPNPQDADPKAVCGHGYVTIVGPPSTAPTPVSILPIQAPMPMEPGGSAIVDAARFIREMLPRLDKIDGDKLPGIVQLRESIQRIDARNGSRTIPLRQTPGREQGK